MLYVLNYDFHFLAYQNTTKFCLHAFILHWLLLLNKVATLFILFVFRNKHSNFHCIYVIKQSLLQTAFQIFLSWFQNLFRREKTVERPSGHPQFFKSKVSTISATKSQLPFIVQSFIAYLNQCINKMFLIFVT